MTVRVSFSEVTAFRDRLQLVAPTARRETRKAVREAGAELTQAIRGAASWSSRIPGATQMKVGFGSRGGVRISVNSAKAPHARPHNFPNDGMNIRHPVFGNRDNWVSTPGHRDWFFKPVRAKERAVVKKIGDAIDKAIQGL